MNKIKKINSSLLRREKLLSKYATRSKDALYLFDISADYRLLFFKDIDKIIHSLSYTRYIDKTQVFTFKNNDNLSKRIIHVQLVSKIARTIGRALNLNEDLIEAASLGHDLGHVPFGHLGEKYLNELSLKNNEGYFNHNIQSVRNLLVLEKKNISIQTLDAIMCHNGEFVKEIFIPKNKTKEDFFKEYQDSYKNKDIIKKLVPMTLEGCVVRISDIVAYLGRDIEDAINLGILKTNDIPKDIRKVLGSTNNEIVDTIVSDIIENSYKKNYIKMSKNIYNAIKKLKKFNYENIYDKANTDSEKKEYKKMFEFLFYKCMDELENNDKKANIYKIFLDNMDKTYKESNSKARIVIDYIAGMTDDYLYNEYKKYNK